MIGRILNALLIPVERLYRLFGYDLYYSVIRRTELEDAINRYMYATVDTKIDEETEE